MNTLPETILAYVNRSPEGQVLSPKELLHLGSRSAVDQALSRLSRDGYLIRVDRGAYVSPVRKGTGVRPPSAIKVIESLAALSGELIAPDGVTSAISLGLEELGRSTGAYFTSGRSRTLMIGNSAVVLHHAPAWMLMLGNSPAGAAVRAMAWKGPTAADQTLTKIRHALSNPEWQTLMACRAALPSWMARAIGEFAARDDGRQQPARRPPKTMTSGSDSTNLDAAMQVDSPANQIIGTDRVCASLAR